MKSSSLFACLPSLLPENDDCEAVTPPPPIEIFPSDVARSKPFITEPIKLQGELTLLKGRVNTAEAFRVGNADLVPGKYEGGLKLWECSTDLVNTLQQEVQNGQLSFRRKRVLELGCGHGLPGILACLKGASIVHFQDFNVEVLQSLTIPNVNANLVHAESRQIQLSNSGQALMKASQLSPDVHYYAGDWADMHKLLSVAGEDQSELADETEGHMFSFQEGDSRQDTAGPDYSDRISSNSARNCARQQPSGSHACERGNDKYSLKGGYDIILMSETVYSLASLGKLYALIKKCLQPCCGVAYLAGKKHYFGVGGGTRQFKSIVEEDGFLEARLVADFADGSSNVREIWNFFLRGEHGGGPKW